MEKFIDIFDERIYFTMEDEKEDLPIFLFIHGFADRGLTISPLKQLKNRKYKIATLDLPGSGKSSLKNNASLEYFSKIVFKLIEKEFIDKEIYIISHSMGAIPGLFNLKVNDKVKHLFLLAPLNYNLLSIENDLNSDIFKWLLPENENDAFDSLFNLVFEPNQNYINGINLLAKKIFDSIDLRKQKFGFLVKEQILSKNYLNNQIRKLFDENSNFTVIFGSEDKFVSKNQMLLLKKDRPDIKFFEIKKCGHAMFYQKAEEINNIINEYLSNK
ncbi:esterase/lipase [Mycoplasmopsis maculosa]|uniref:Esterase/lipase n=1 Tax=Mycoplasmopsis maculosa TaxID=114885 RepID=A0A449B4X5_9BACT|nr:alpha/beta fold hydrolase [Mycoplasmopsis maculosa]VEU75625.1 esterase/lipase [Mycoplasmopsis maculosa]